jgi:hypothetical protein
VSGALDVDAEIDGLFALPLDQFVSARNELARRVRAEVGSEEAERVRRLRKPSLPAWAVNQLARKRPGDVAALLEATERSRRAALEGDASSLRSSARERNALVAGLTRAAADILEAAGAAGARAHLERIRNTLLASASDADAAELLRRGRLTEALEASGFDAFGAVAPAPEPDPDEDQHERAAARDRLRALEGEADEAAARARRLEERAAAAEAEAAAARAAAKQARARAESARRMLS